MEKGESVYAKNITGRWVKKKKIQEVNNENWRKLWFDSQILLQNA
jgi:hypothetical protein